MTEHMWTVHYGVCQLGRVNCQAKINAGDVSDIEECRERQLQSMKLDQLDVFQTPGLLKHIGAYLGPQDVFCRALDSFNPSPIHVKYVLVRPHRR